MIKRILLAAAMASFAAGAAHAEGDPALGKKQYVQCGICHGMQGQGSSVGPTLKGIVGRKAGAIPAFNYSPAMKASGLTWTEANLSAYLAAPQAKVKGTRMVFAGLKKPGDADNMVAFLKTLK